MAEIKTKKNEGNVENFLQSIDNEKRREDSYIILDLMKNLTQKEPKMWGSSIVGFGSYHYKYDSGREGKWFLTGFSPRKQALTLYIMPGFDNKFMQQLGKFKTGKSCLYIKKLEDVKMDVLEKLIAESIKNPPSAV